MSADSKSISDYELRFEFAIVTPAVRNLFAQFLERSLVLENLAFYEEVLQYEKIISNMSSQAATVSSVNGPGSYRSSERETVLSVGVSSSGSNRDKNLSPFERLQRLAQGIVDRFIKNGCVDEVNLPADVKQNVLSSFKQCVEGHEGDSTSSWKIIFGDARRMVLTSLKLDNWPRFVRSRVWLDWIENKWQKNRQEAVVILEQAGVSKEEKEREIDSVMFTPDELFSSYVLQKDVDFIEQTLQDSSDWKTVYDHGDGSQGFFNERQYFKNLNDAKGEWAMVKQVMYIPFNYEHVFSAMSTDAYSKLDPLIFDLSQYAFHPSNSENPYASTIFAARMKTLFFLSHRVIPTASTTFFNPEKKSFRCIHRPTLDPSIPHFKRHVVGSGWYCYHYEAHGDHMCRLTQLYYMNLGGWLKNKNKSLFIHVVKKRSKTMTDATIRVVQEYEDKKRFPKSDDMLGIFATVEENCKAASLPLEQWPSMLQREYPNQSEETRYYPDRRRPPFTGDMYVKKYRLKKNISHAYRP